MKIGLTGHKGFIGKRMVERLVLAGHEIQPYEENLLSWGKRINEDKYPFEEFKDCDLIINLAGKNKGTDKEIVSTNVLGTLNLLQWCFSHNKNVFLAGSDYKHEGAYKHSRDTIKAMCRSYNYINPAFNSCILNMPKIIGPGCRPHYNSFVSTLVWIAGTGDLTKYLYLIKDKEEVVELLHVDDICDSVIDLIDHPSSGYTEYEFTKYDGKFSIKLGEIADILLGKNLNHPKAGMFLTLKEWYKENDEWLK